MSDELKPIVGSVEPPMPADIPEVDAVEEIKTDLPAENVDVVADVVVEPKKPKPLPTRVTIPVAVDINAVKDALPKPAGPSVVGNGEVDEVRLSACVYKNVNAQKSLTVYHLQRRLVELGFVEADLDKQGFYGGPTKIAVKNFQASKKLEVTGIMDAVTFTAVFKGDPNVKVIL